MYVFLNGKFLSAGGAKISIFDHGFLYGDGVYETLRSVKGKVFDAENHIKRLQNSAEFLKIKVPYSSKEIISATQELLEKNNFSAEKESRIRWTLTRGENNFCFYDCKSPTFSIITTELEPYNSEYFTKGISVTTLHLSRILPNAKHTSLVSMILGKQKCIETGSYECLFTEKDGSITEGTVSNFCIQKENEIWTSPQEKVLPGTAMKIFRKKGETLGQKFIERKFSAGDVISANAAFLTNSLYGVLPVTEIDGQKVGKGNVGDLFQKVSQDFWDT